VRLAPLALAVSIGALAPGVAAAAPPLRLLELPDAEALPRIPPLAPPQPPLAEVARLRGTVEARERVSVRIDAAGTPTSVEVEQRLLVRALGDYAFFIPAPAVSVVAAAGTESQPGFRPNQIVWQGFSPRRKVLAATAELRPGGSVGALPIRVRLSGAPTRPGPFELVVSLENATETRVRTFSADASQADLSAALDALRAAAGIQRAVPERFLPIRGMSVPATVDVSAAFALRGEISFPAGSVRDVSRRRFSGTVGGEKLSLRITVRGVASRPAAPKVEVVAEPNTGAAIPEDSSSLTLDAVIRSYLSYARTRQYQTFLANPDPQGPSATTYVFETAAPARPEATPEPEPSDDSSLAPFVAVAGLALLGLGLVVLWAHL
jgi:hypothetical protein